MVVMYQDCLSPHQLPLARALVERLGETNFRYVYRDQTQVDRVQLGWDMRGSASWQIHLGSQGEEARRLVESSEVILTGFRDVDLFERRAARGLMTFYASERWFKPLFVGQICGWLDYEVSGKMRMLHPRFNRMANRLVHWLKSDPHAAYLAVGPWARKDMRALGVPEEKIRPWGYFVAPSEESYIFQTKVSSEAPLRILYLGRLLKLKRVDTILRAVAHVKSFQPKREVSLSIVGSGPEEANLRRLATSLKLDETMVSFKPSVPISKVRRILRAHDVLVFASNALDGWGAVVSEALEEGVAAIGTRETGAAPTLLPPENLFPCGDDRALVKCIMDFKTVQMPKAYTATGAAERLLGWL